MHSDQIRSVFLDFFSRRGHLLVPEGTLTPDDDSLLFTNAGMVQFKPYFVGDEEPPQPRLMTAQRCVRTVDIDNIGHTTRHATSFEMLGNFSFGDYFKIESMQWALELLTGGFGLDRQRLSTTVLEGDSETIDLWRRLGVPRERIREMGPEDNFWSMGVPGTSGPTTEIFYERDDGELLEIWNIVFMRRDYIDTGLGQDRLAMILQDVPHLQAIDTVQPLLSRVQALSQQQNLVAQRIITDHVRTSVLMIEAGVTPSNSGRGYVLRRLLRRAIYQLHRLGVSQSVLGDLTGSPVVAKEAKLFERTLRSGSRLLESQLQRGHIDALTAFKLHDTHGFPIDLTEEIGRERSVRVDREGFDRLMTQHRSRSRGLGNVG